MISLKFLFLFHILFILAAAQNAADIKNSHYYANVGNEGQEHAGSTWQNPADASTGKIDHVKMHHHSFDAPFNAASLFQDWELLMSTVPVFDYLVLTPGVQERVGHIWNRTPILTNNFQAEFLFKIHDTSPLFEGFAFWLVKDPSELLYANAPDSNGPSYNIFGQNNHPPGLGIYFKLYDYTKNLNPSITAIYSNGTASINSQFVVNERSTFFNFVSDAKDWAHFRVSVGPRGIMGEIKMSSSDWVHAFTLPVILEKGFHVGMTAYTGPQHSSAKANPKEEDGVNRVLIKQLTFLNFDLSQAGETNAAADDLLHSMDNADIIGDAGNFKNSHELAEALKQLTRLLYKHIAELSPREQETHRTLNILLNRFQRMTSEIKELRHELQLVFEKVGLHPSGGTDLHSVKHELSSLRNMFHQHSQNYSSSLENLHSTLTKHVERNDDPQLREFNERAANLESVLDRRAFIGWCVIGGLMIFLFLMNLLFKSYMAQEKTHFL